MFVGVARLALQIPGSGSLKSKRQVLRKVIDRLRARYNLCVAEVEDNDLWQRATLAVSVLGNERAHVNEQLDKITQYVEDMYVAPLLGKEMEILSFGEDLFTRGSGTEFDTTLELPFPKGDRSLAEAEGMGDWESRHQGKTGTAPRAPKPLSIEERRERARSLRRPRDWEDK